MIHSDLTTSRSTFSLQNESFSRLIQRTFLFLCVTPSMSVFHSNSEIFSSPVSTMSHSWELQLKDPGNYNFYNRETSTCLRVSRLGCDVSGAVRMCWSELQRVRLCVDAWAVMSAHRLWPWPVEVLGPHGTAAAGTDSRGSAGKVATKLPPRSQQEIGDAPRSSMLLVDVLWCCSLSLSLCHIVVRSH